MEILDILPWLLVLLFAGATAYFAVRREDNDFAKAVERLAREVEAGDDPDRSAEGDPPEILALRQAISRGWRPVGGGGGDPAQEALTGLVRYMKEAVLAPLRAAEESADPAVINALAALEDLTFYAESRDDDTPQVWSLGAIIQGVTREYALETGISVKFRGPSGAVPVKVAPEQFKDALFLILANAGRFSGGETVEVSADSEGDRVLIRVKDRGTGFTREALEHAFDPFWSSDADALGLGLTHARRVIEKMDGVLEIGNTEDGGGEVVISMPRAS